MLLRKSFRCLRCDAVETEERPMSKEEERVGVSTLLERIVNGEPCDEIKPRAHACGDNQAGLMIIVAFEGRKEST